MGLRIKGIEVALIFIGPTGVEETVGKMKSMEINVLGEILTEEYIDEDAPDFDDISMGCEVKCMAHLNDPAFFQLIQRVENRRRRIGSPSGKFSAGGRFLFPDQGTQRIVVPNLFFGDLPIRVGGRKDYVNTEINAKAKQAFFKRAA